MRIQPKHVVIALVCAAGLVFVLAVAALMALGVMAELQVVPDTVCLRGEDVRAADVDWLRGEGILSDGEELQWFYSGGLFSIAEDGNLFTDRRVISYFEYEGERWHDEALLEEVADLRADWGAGFLDDTVLTVVLDDEYSFELLLSADEEADHAFVRDLRKAVVKARRRAGLPVDPDRDDR